MRRVYAFCLLTFATGAGSALAHAEADVVDVKKECARLQSEDRLEHGEATLRLKKAGKSAVVPLVEVIDAKGKPMAKERAGRVLREILGEAGNRDQAGLNEVVRLTRSKDRRTVKLGVFALAGFKGDKKAANALRDVAKGKYDEILRAQALGALLDNTSESPSEVPFLKKFLTDESQHVRLWAAGYLGRLGDSSGKELVRQVLEAPPSKGTADNLRIAAAIAAGTIKSPDLIPALEKVSSSEQYGSAMWEADLALREIELAKQAKPEARAGYIARKLKEGKYARWAAAKLKKLARQGDGNALRILEEAAHDSQHPGSFRAKRALVGLGEMEPERGH